MHEATDHTYEVEKRVIAIPVKALDCCAFFQRRENALTMLHECWYCVHGGFFLHTDEPNASGFCQFRR